LPLTRTQKSNKFHQIVGPLDFSMPFKDCLDFRKTLVTLIMGG
jgi:hypothetical protein